MLSLFRTNQILSTIFVLVFAALLLAAPVLLKGEYQAQEYGIFHHYLQQSFIKGNFTTALLIALLFLFMGAFAANHIDRNFRLSREINMMPGYFYVLVSCTIPVEGVFSPLYAANFFLLISLHELMDTFKKNTVADRIFNAGLFLAIACLFYPSYLVFILLVFTGLNVMRGFNLQERFMAVSGVLVPFVLTGVVTFWLNHFDLFWKLQFTQAFAWLNFANEPINMLAILVFAVLLLLLLVIIFQQSDLTGKRVIQSQKRINLLYWSLLVPVLSVPIQAQVQLQHLIILAPGLGMLTGVLFSSTSRNWAEFLHFVWFALVMILKYQAFIFPG